MANLLAGEASAYLRSAAHQPVHWLPWGEAAFAHARAHDRPILLDIGAVWCHWCHVMDGESYDDAAIAAILNRDFICIKVDRDERPDVDTRYQRAVSALSGQAGWPLTAFLTPDGDVFFGGTYFPPDDPAAGRPGFATMLRHVARLYREDPDRVRANARAIREHITATLTEGKAGVVTASLVEHGADAIARAYDVRYGGFGTAPKFPHPGALELLLARWWDTRADWPREIVEKTLRAMARGGIHDHVGGGFHRYAVDERWIVPHFEKMIYDNAELLRAYCAGFAAFGTPLFRDVANGIVNWVLEVLTDRDRGAFFASQDADADPGDDGDYWTWTPGEARAVLTEAEYAVAQAVFDIDDAGEMRHNPRKNVLWRRHEPRDDAERALLVSATAALKAARDARRPPFVDTTAYVNWNAMLAGAMLQAGAILDRPECNDVALRVLYRIWNESWESDRGMRHVIDRPEPRGMLDDHVQAAVAFLDAFEATGDVVWRERAATLMQHCLAAYVDETDGGFFDVLPRADAAGYLTARAKPIQDAPTASPNGTGAIALARLWVLTGDRAWRAALDRHLAAFAGTAEALSVHGASLLRAIDWAVHPVTQITVAGPAGPGAACTMHLLALQTYRPRRAVLRTAAAEPAATVCVDTTCSLPAVTADAFAQLLT